MRIVGDYGLEAAEEGAVRHDGTSRAKQYLEQKVKEEVKPEEIRAEEVVLKKFGLGPAGIRSGADDG